MKDTTRYSDVSAERSYRNTFATVSSNSPSAAVRTGAWFRRRPAIRLTTPTRLQQALSSTCPCCRTLSSRRSGTAPAAGWKTVMIATEPRYRRAAAAPPSSPGLASRSDPNAASKTAITIAPSAIAAAPRLRAPSTSAIGGTSITSACAAASARKPTAPKRAASSRPVAASRLSANASNAHAVTRADPLSVCAVR